MSKHYISNIHIRQPEQKQVNRGGITISYRPTDDSHLYEVGFTVCSDKDQFVRKVGSRIARERLEDNPLVVDIHEAFKDVFMSAYDITGTNFSDERLEKIHNHHLRLAEIDADFYVENPIRSYTETVIVDAVLEYLFGDE